MLSVKSVLRLNPFLPRLNMHSPPSKRIENTLPSLKLSLPYASQHIFLLFRIILSGGFCIHTLISLGSTLQHR